MATGNVPLPPCAFCGGTEGDFLPVGRRHGVPVRVHEECVEWAPECYEADGKWVGIRKAVKRSGKCRCPVCGKGHAALGCAVTSCKKSFHLECARKVGCSFNLNTYTILCPDHIDEEHPPRAPNGDGEGAAGASCTSDDEDSRSDSSFTGVGTDEEEDADDEGEDDDLPLIRLARRKSRGSDDKSVSDNSEMNAAARTARRQSAAGASTRDSPLLGSEGTRGANATDVRRDARRLQLDKSRENRRRQQRADAVNEQNVVEELSVERGESVRAKARRAKRNGELIVKKGDARFMVEDNEVRYSDWTPESSDIDEPAGRGVRRAAASEAFNRLNAIKETGGSDIHRGPLATIGTKFKKRFSDRVYNGVVDGFNTRSNKLHVVYSDNDSEELSPAQLSEYLEEFATVDRGATQSMVETDPRTGHLTAPASEPALKRNDVQADDVAPPRDRQCESLPAVDDGGDDGNNGRAQVESPVAKTRRRRVKLESDSDEELSEEIGGDDVAVLAAAADTAKQTSGICRGADESREGEQLKVPGQISPPMRTAPPVEVVPDRRSPDIAQMDRPAVPEPEPRRIALPVDDYVDKDEAMGAGGGADSDAFVRSDNDDISESEWTEGWEEEAYKRGVDVDGAALDTATGPPGDAAVGGLSASDDGPDVESSDGHDDDNGVYDRFEDADGEELDIIATDGESDQDEGLLRAKRQAELGGKRHLVKQDTRFIVSDDEERYSDWTQDSEEELVDKNARRKKPKMTAKDFVAQAMARNEDLFDGDVPSGDEFGRDEGYDHDYDETNSRRQRRRGKRRSGDDDGGDMDMGASSDDGDGRRRGIHARENAHRKRKSRITDFVSERPRTHKKRKSGVRATGEQDRSNVRGDAAKKAHKKRQAWWSVGPSDHHRRQTSMDEFSSERRINDDSMHAALSRQLSRKDIGAIGGTGSSDLPWPIDIDIPVPSRSESVRNDIRRIAKRAEAVFRVSSAALPLSTESVSNEDYSVSLFGRRTSLLCLDNAFDDCAQRFAQCLAALGQTKSAIVSSGDVAPLSKEEALAECESFYALAIAMLYHVSGTTSNATLDAISRAALPDASSVRFSLSRLFAQTEAACDGIAIDAMCGRFHWHKLLLCRSMPFEDEPVAVTHAGTARGLSQPECRGAAAFGWTKSYLMRVANDLLDQLHGSKSRGSSARPPELASVALWTEWILAADASAPQSGGAWRLLSAVLTKRRDKENITATDGKTAHSEQVLQQLEFEWEVVFLICKLYLQVDVAGSRGSAPSCSKDGCWSHVKDILRLAPLDSVLKGTSNVGTAILMRCSALSRHWEPDIEIPALLFNQLQKFIASGPADHDLDCQCCKKVCRTVLDGGSVEASWWRNVFANGAIDVAAVRRPPIFLSGGSACSLVMNVVDVHLSRFANRSLQEGEATDEQKKLQVATMRRVAAKLFRELQQGSVGIASQKDGKPPAEKGSAHAQCDIVRCKAIHIRHAMQMLTILRRHLPPDQHAILVKRILAFSQQQRGSDAVFNNEMMCTILLEGLFHFCATTVSGTAPENRKEIIQSDAIMGEIWDLTQSMLQGLLSRNRNGLRREHHGIAGILLRCCRVIVISELLDPLRCLPVLSSFLRRYASLPQSIVKATCYATHACVLRLLKTEDISQQQQQQQQQDADGDGGFAGSIEQFVLHPVIGILRTFNGSKPGAGVGGQVPSAFIRSGDGKACCSAVAPLAAGCWALLLRCGRVTVGDLLVSLPLFDGDRRMTRDTTVNFLSGLFALDGCLGLASAGDLALSVWAGAVHRVLTESGGAGSDASAFLGKISSHLKGDAWSRTFRDIDCYFRQTDDDDAAPEAGRTTNFANRLMTMRTGAPSATNAPASSGTQAGGRREADIRLGGGILRLVKDAVSHTRGSVAAASNALGAYFLDAGLSQQLMLCAEDSLPLKSAAGLISALPGLVVAEMHRLGPDNPKRLNTTVVTCMVPYLKVLQRGLGVVENGSSNTSTGGAMKLLAVTFEMLASIVREDLKSLVSTTGHRSHQRLDHQRGNEPSGSELPLVGAELTGAHIFYEVVIFTAARQAARCVLSLRQTGKAAFASAGRQQASLTQLRETLLIAINSGRQASPRVGALIRNRVPANRGANRRIDCDVITASLKEMEQLGVMAPRMSSVRRQLPTAITDIYRDNDNGGGGSARATDFSDDPYSSNLRMLTASLSLLEAFASCGGNFCTTIAGCQTYLVLSLKIAEADGGRESDRKAVLDVVRGPISRILQSAQSRTMRQKLNVSDAINP